MKFAIMCYNWEPFAYDLKSYEHTAILAERLGYDTFFISDHFIRPFLPVQRSNIKRHITYEAWTVLSYLAAKTSTIRLGTCVTPLPVRFPPLLAKVVATLDHLSNGRVTLGVGAGDDKNEMETYSYFGSKDFLATKSIEAMTLIKKLWTEELVDFNGRFYRVSNAVLEPKPVQKPHPPIWTGAMGERMLQATAELCDGWIPARSIGATPEFYEKGARLIKTVAAERGKKMMLGLMGYVLGEGAESPFPYLGMFDEVASIIEQYRALGCEYFITAFLPPARTSELAERFAREVIPSFS
jgi:alkanesulfonate monooxygenase SsuD/methylene tetrahydromethanopterin reductase-like flavin-dependent oxidoreductase (luciferase family)